MAQRGILPVLQFRGRIRAMMRGGKNRMAQLQRYNAAHPDNPPFTDPQIAKMLEVENILAASLANRIKV